MDRSKFDEMMNKSIQSEQKVSEDTNTTNIPSVLNINQVDVQKLNLSNGDTLAVTIKSDDLDQSNLNALKSELEKIFPNNKVFLFGMRPTDSVEFSVVSQEKVNYCNDCSCGKKDQALADLENQ